MNNLAYPIYELKPGSFIYRIAGSLSRSEAKWLVDFFEDNEEYHYDGITGGGFNTDLKVTRDIAFQKLVDKGGVYAEVDKLLYDSLADSLVQLKELRTFGSDLQTVGADFMSDYGYMFSCYPTGGYYNWHHDGGDQQNRQLTALWYLNDIPKEAGGATEFLDQGITVQPKAGDLLLFPANWTHVHRAQKLLEGKKYIATTWIL